MKLLSLPFLAISAGALVLHKDTCDPTCDPKCGPLGQFSLEELEAEIQRRKTATGCTTTASPTDAATTTAGSTTTGFAGHPLCTVQDGSAISADYPCTCGAMDTTGVTCYDNSICTGSGGGGAPGPAPAFIQFFKQAPGPAGAPAGGGGPSGSCSAPPDNFADELVDQGDIPFETLDKDKDGCLSDKEMTDHLKEQRSVHRKRGYYWQEKDVEEHHDHLEQNGHEASDRADKDQNGCLGKAEYDKVQKSGRDCPKQFMLMDHNADGKISRQEAATHVTEHIDGGSLNYDVFREIFEAADVNKDHFLTQAEFCDAGPKYTGDGKEAF